MVAVVVGSALMDAVDFRARASRAADIVTTTVCRIYVWARGPEEIYEVDMS